MTVLQDVCHHTTRLRDIDVPLAREISILNQSWKRIVKVNRTSTLGLCSTIQHTGRTRSNFSIMREFGVRTLLFTCDGVDSVL